MKTHNIKVAKNLTYATDGKGWWSTRKCDVKIKAIQVVELDGYCHSVSLKVYFDTRQWKPELHGLIYSDNNFVDELRRSLKAAGYKYTADIDYSEQGMQGADFVHFDVTLRFCRSNFPEATRRKGRKYSPRKFDWGGVKFG